jgi:hypothetical protein
MLKKFPIRMKIRIVHSEELYKSRRVLLNYVAIDLINNNFSVIYFNVFAYERSACKTLLDIKE